jgi:MFS family permease
MVAALGFAAMLQLKLAGLWQIYLLAVVLGLVMALDTPAQSAFVGDITGREHMQGAIVLNSMIMQLSRTLGPALAGVMLSIFSSSSVFWINGASFLFVIGTLFAIRTRKETEKPPSGADSMNDAFKFVRKNPRALDLIIICVIMTFFAFGTGTLLPAIVTDTLHKGASTMGLLEGVTGAGPLLGSFIIVPLVSRVKHSGRLLTFALCYLGTLMLILALSSYFFISVWFWVVSMFLSTFAVPVIMTISNTILQHIAPENMRGRLINVMFMFAFGLQPFGSLIIGFLGSAFGSIFAFEIYGMALILGGLIMIIFRKGLFDWQPMKGGI